jgi:hypothetical protein
MRERGEVDRQADSHHPGDCGEQAAKAIFALGFKSDGHVRLAFEDATHQARQHRAWSNLDKNACSGSVHGLDLFYPADRRAEMLTEYGRQAAVVGLGGGIGVHGESRGPKGLFGKKGGEFIPGGGHDGGMERRCDRELGAF